MKTFLTFLDDCLILLFVVVTAAWVGFLCAGLRWLFVRSWAWPWFWLAFALTYGAFGLAIWNNRDRSKPPGRRLV